MEENSYWSFSYWNYICFSINRTMKEVLICYRRGVQNTFQKHRVVQLYAEILGFFQLRGVYHRKSHLHQDR
jgi:hypothetical protein